MPLDHRASTGKQICLFANPHIHHSYFTVQALSTVVPVIILCPPLQLQLLQKKWSTLGLRIKPPSTKQRLVQVLCLIGFLLFKLKLIRERQYLYVFSRGTDLLLRDRRGYILVHYQDYLSLSDASLNSIAYNICEMIISTTELSHNYQSTLNSANTADLVVCPSTSLANNFSYRGIKTLLAPYGGDKSDFLAKANFQQTPKCSQYKRTTRKSVVICARANSHRKGLDILLESLAILNNRISQIPYESIDIRICGSLHSLEDANMLRLFASKFNKKISITAKQYSQKSYNAIISSSDFFVMPSRLEGTSPAALEALWHGVPCILSAECGIDSFINGRHGVLMKSLSSTCLAESLYELISNVAATRQMAANLAEDKDLFSWSNYFNTYTSMLLNLENTCQ